MMIIKFLKVEKGNKIMVWLIQLRRNTFKGKSKKVTTNVITSSSYIIHELCVLFSLVGYIKR